MAINLVGVAKGGDLRLFCPNFIDTREEAVERFIICVNARGRISFGLLVQRHDGTVQGHLLLEEGNQLKVVSGGEVTMLLESSRNVAIVRMSTSLLL
jgi:hypothetical protein